MKKIIHISDLHFGRENPNAVAALLHDINKCKPTVVIVSGDLTQRARHRQFKSAAEFLAKIHFPTIVVPGNHDVPLFDVTRRFLAPFNRYVRYINADFYPTYKDEKTVIIGINTAYSFTWKSGRVTKAQLQILREKFKSEGNKLKMLVVHHPFRELFYDGRYHSLLNDLNVDVIFSGHLHQASAKILDNHVTKLNLKTLLVESGTSVSKRLRGENNSYNQLEISPENNLTILIKEYDGNQFIEKTRLGFRKEDTFWKGA